MGISNKEDRMSINNGMNYESVLAEMRETNKEIEIIGIKVSLYASAYKAIGEKAKVCHDSLKAFNDAHFPRVEK
jgi:hypothetical protein